MSRSLVRLLPLPFLLTCMAWAQSGAGQGAVVGNVSDPTGKSVLKADVTLRSTGTGLTRRATTDSEGHYLVGALPVGTYIFEATAPGFGTARVADVDVTVGETKTVNAALQLASTSTQISVVEGAQIVNETEVASSTSLNQRAIEDLPIRGRNFTQFMQLTPNSVQETNRFGIVINGQRSHLVNISLDGVDFNDPLQGGQRGGGANQSAYFFPQVAVREFQVIRDGASSEIGRTNSGYVNVVTKSGTNEIHREAFYNNRNGSLTSPDAFGNDSSANAQNQFGGGIGGPIRKDKLFFFAAIEKNLVTIPYTVRFNAPTGGTPIPTDIAALQGTFAGKNNPLVAFGRLDYQSSPKHFVNFQYTYAAQFGLTFNGPTGQTNAAVTNNLELDRASQGVKGAVTSILSSSMINEVRSQWAYDNRLFSPKSLLPEIDFSDNWAVLGGGKAGYEIYNVKKFQILDNLTWSHGLHTVKVGVDININPEQQLREANYSGLYLFKSLADYQAALAGDKTKISRYQQSVAANGTQGKYEGTQQDHALFITDTVRLRRDLTVTAGLRWEGQINPQPTSPNPVYPITSKIPNDLKMWQPRLGFAWNVGAKGTTVIRASGGIFDAHTPGYLMQKVFTDNGVNTLVLDTNVDPALVSYITVPLRVDAPPTGVKTPLVGFIFGFDPSYKNPRSGQVALSVEQKLDRDTKLTVGFVRNSTWGLQRRIDTNLYQPSIMSNGMPVYPTFDTAGNLVYASRWDPVTGPVFLDSAGKTLKAAVARPDPRVAQININKSVGHSSYNGFTMTIEHRMSHRLQATANFTHAFNRDDDSNERDFNRQTALNTYNLKLDSAWSKNDIRNNGNLNFLYDLGRGFTLSSLFLAHTAAPVKAVVGADLQNDGNSVNDVPILNGSVVPRNSLRGPGFLDWDMRLLKEFKLGESARLLFSVEGFNLTRSTNKLFSSDGETSFGNPTAAVNAKTGFAYSSNTALIPTSSPGTDYFGGARQAQFGARFVF
ncbi:MAG: hypothetical protein JWN34_4538 [Bryobacterales bacterium]|nr:hypothetical protein [Bryobacterales bacterium]